MADVEYHRNQAVTLIRLAQETRDQETARALMRLASEHTALVEEGMRGRDKRPKED